MPRVGDIGVGLALVLEDLLDDPGEPRRALAEHALGGADQILLAIGGGDRLRARAFGSSGGRRRDVAGGGRIGGRGRVVVGKRRAGLDRGSVLIGLGGGRLRVRGRIEVRIDRGVGVDRRHLGMDRQRPDGEHGHRHSFNQPIRIAIPRANRSPPG